jgi:NAD(P)-dependent dehydrogenase (short-subunit alcohol dehydrogenase family)
VTGAAIDILVANTGYLTDLMPMTSSDLEEWWKGFEISVKGDFQFFRSFVPHAAKNATVIDISTGIVQLPYVPGYSGYHTSKLVAAKLFDYVHREYPDFFVLNVHPGVIRPKRTRSSKGPV